MLYCHANSNIIFNITTEHINITMVGLLNTINHIREYREDDFLYGVVAATATSGTQTIGVSKLGRWNHKHDTPSRMI